MQDVVLYCRAYPPHGIGGETESAIRVEPLHRLHHAKTALANEVADRQAVAAIGYGDLCHQAQMRRDKLVRRLHILCLAPATSQRQFVLWREHREFADFLKV